MSYPLLQTHTTSSEFGAAYLRSFPFQTLSTATIDLVLLATYPFG
jgi:hypothetical protein